MIIVADPETRQRWEIRGNDCSTNVAVESLDHCRWLLTRHSGHGSSCRPLISALGRVVF